MDLSFDKTGVLLWWLDETSPWDLGTKSCMWYSLMMSEKWKSENNNWRTQTIVDMVWCWTRLDDVIGVLESDLEVRVMTSSGMIASSKHYMSTCSLLKSHVWSSLKEGFCCVNKRCHVKIALCWDPPTCVYNATIRIIMHIWWSSSYSIMDDRVTQHPCVVLRVDEDACVGHCTIVCLLADLARTWVFVPNRWYGVGMIGICAYTIIWYMRGREYSSSFSFRDLKD